MAEYGRPFFFQLGELAAPSQNGSENAADTLTLSGLRLWAWHRFMPNGLVFMLNGLVLLLGMALFWHPPR